MPSEFELINAFVKGLPHAKAPVGPGDDCALPPKPRERLCLTTDATVEGVHFTRDHFDMEEIGHKALAANLSDLASMGAVPKWWLCALGVPPNFVLAEALALARGMRPLAVKHGLVLLGGNVTSSPVLSLTLTLAGEAKKPMLRSGAKAGDLLYVCGELGEARAGLALMQTLPETESDERRRVLLAQRRPSPRIAEGRIAGRFAHAAIDVSDGLLQDLAHVCNSSKVAAHLESALLPLSPALKSVAGAQAMFFALLGGEDYALLLAVPEKSSDAFEREMKKNRLRATRVGRFAKGRGVWLDGVRQADNSGHDHLARR
jgi:thiamine-monophosphate kinase